MSRSKKVILFLLYSNVNLIDGWKSLRDVKKVLRSASECGHRMRMSSMNRL